MRFRWGAISALAMMLATTSAGAMTIEEAIRLTVQTNPSIGEAAANRRAVDYELKQAVGQYLPQVSLDGSFGSSRVRTDQVGVLPPLRSDKWFNPAQGQLVVRQLIFDGFATSNDIFRQAARVDAAALRVLERSELLGLDAAEAYIDILRHEQILGVARRNIAKHQEIYGLVRRKFDGGSGSISEVQQVEERLAASRAVESDVIKSLEDTKAKFRRIVGAEPRKLSSPRGIAGLPATREAAISVARANHPTLAVAAADTDAAQFNADRTLSGYMPRIYAEGVIGTGEELQQIRGPRQEATGRIVMSMNLFDGGIREARRGEAIERLGEAQIRQDTLRRQVDEAAERAFINRATTGSRVAALQQQVAAAERVVTSYRQEYDLSRRSLLDLLDAENTLFNARTQLVTSRFIRVFSEYQLAASTGALLRKLSIHTLAEGTTGTQERWGQVRSVPSGFAVEPLRQ